MCVKSNMETYIAICKIDSQQEFVCGSGNSNRAQNQSRGVGRGGRWEGGSEGRGHMYTDG